MSDSVTHRWQKAARQLTENERLVLLGLASSARDADRKALTCQVERVLVTGECHACGSLELSPDRVCDELAQRTGFVSNAEWLKPRDKPTRSRAAVILFVKDGYISFLEVVGHDEELRGLPHHDTLTYLGG